MLKSINQKNQEKTLTLGILGGGQLAKMLALEGYRMGLNIAIIDKEPNTPAGDMTKLEFSRGWNDVGELEKFVDVSDVITLENEFINPEILQHISQSKEVYPSADTMKLIQDKFIQKDVLKKRNILVPKFEEVNNDLNHLVKSLGYPFLIKTRTLGYDGYGNFLVKNELDFAESLNKFSGRTLMAEEFINFERELAVMIVRSRDDEVKSYPVVETQQMNHICHKVIAPARIDSGTHSKAIDIATKSIEAVNGVGIFGVEMFLTKSREILINEIAPRPHNSGHYTIEGCATSQFENAIRAVLNLPLGNTDMLFDAVCMINLLGVRDGIGIPKKINDILKVSNIKLHLYNKKESRIGRKMGHLTT
jgi:5-(carboxyamino)imidazole ribonucleotide synthase